MSQGLVDIKRAVVNEKQVQFLFYVDGELWYETEHEEKFPVPISDIGEAKFKNKDKALLFMRYMRMWNKRLKGENTK